MGEVVELDCVTTLDLPPDRVLEAAKGKLVRVIVFGDTEDGETYIAGSSGDLPTAFWMVERCKKRLLEQVE